MKKLTFTLGALCYCLCLFAQSDTLVVYDVENQTVEIVPPVDFDPSITFEQTNSFEGLLGNSVILSDTPPTTNLYDGAQFNVIQHAADFFPVTSYPARTAVKILLYKADTIRATFSGQMVGCKSVLTASWPLFDFDNEEWKFDRIEVIPAFDLGGPTLGIANGEVEKCFVFKRYYDTEFILNMALLELTEPIGIETGWIGIAHAEDSFFEERVFHKLSYPAETNPLSWPDWVNGDTLYYNYGYVDIFLPYLFGIAGVGSVAIPGQDGSSLFFSNENGMASLGVSSWAVDQKHHRISPGLFYQLKNVIEECDLSGVDDNNKDFYFEFNPNPFSSYVNFEFSNSNGADFNFKLFNSMGQLVFQEKGTGRQFLLERNDLPAGIYFFQMSGLQPKSITGRLIAQ